MGDMTICGAVETWMLLKNFPNPQMNQNLPKRELNTNRGNWMGTAFAVVVAFVVGFVVDMYFGTKILSKLETLLNQTEANVIAAVKTELGKLTVKL